MRQPYRPEPRGSLIGHTGDVFAVGWDPTVAHLATGSDDRSIRIWDARQLTISTRAALKKACTMTGRGLTEAEWRQHLSGIPYRPTCPSP